MKIKSIILLILLLLTFCSISVASALRESLTFDEPVHIQEGMNALLRHTFVIDTFNPPFAREFAAFPLIFQADSLIHFNDGIHPSNSPLPLMKVLPARLMTLALAVGLALAVFFAAYFYIGITEAFIALFLFIFDPNILANDHYITLDTGFILFFFLSYVLLLKIFNRQNQRPSPHVSNKTILRFIQDRDGITYLLLALTIGLGLASKVSFIPYFLLSALLLLILKKRKESFSFLWSQKYHLLLTFILSLVVLWATYFFTTDVIVAQRSDSGRVSYKLEQYAKKHHVAFLSSFLQLGEHQPVPLGNYLAMIKNNTIRNAVGNKYFFLGQFYPKHQWYFVPVYVFLKTPIALIILFFISTLCLARRLMRKGKSSGLMYKFSSWFTETKNGKYEYTSFFLIPIIVTLFIGSSTNTTPIVRYILPIYPFVAMVASQGVVFLMQKQYGKIMVCILLFWYLFSTLLYYPHFISYSNEFLGINHTKDMLFMDSNMDWGESLPDLKQYVNQKNPGTLLFSYFGRDDANLYGLKSNLAYGSYKFEEICSFHTVPVAKKGDELTAISLSNWYYCGYYKKPQLEKSKVKDIVGHSILIY